MVRIMIITISKENYLKAIAEAEAEGKHCDLRAPRSLAFRNTTL